MKSVDLVTRAPSKFREQFRPLHPPRKLKASRSYVMSPKNYLCVSRVGDREGTGESLTDRMVSRKKEMTVILLRQEF